MKIQKTIGAGVMSLGLVVGLAGFAGATSGDIYKTGPDSNNVVRVRNNHRVRVSNDTDLHAYNHNDQWSSTGKAVVAHNTSGGSARSGNASNANSTNVSATVRNTSTSGLTTSSSTGGNNTASIDTTGPDSNNRVNITNNSSVNVDNDTDISVSNSNHQSSRSGDAVVAGNTTGGSATSGNASNTNSTSMSFNVTN